MYFSCLDSDERNVKLTRECLDMMLLKRRKQVITINLLFYKISFQTR